MRAISFFTALKLIKLIWQVLTSSHSVKSRKVPEHRTRHSNETNKSWNSEEGKTDAKKGEIPRSRLCRTHRLWTERKDPRPHLVWIMSPCWVCLTQSVSHCRALEQPRGAAGGVPAAQTEPCDRGWPIQYCPFRNANSSLEPPWTLWTLISKEHKSAESNEQIHSPENPNWTWQEGRLARWSRCLQQKLILMQTLTRGGPRDQVGPGGRVGGGHTHRQRVHEGLSTTPASPTSALTHPKLSRAPTPPTTQHSFPSSHL